MGLFSVNTLDNRNTSRDEHLRAPAHDTDFTCSHPKSVLYVYTCQYVEIHTGRHDHLSHLPHVAKSQHDTRSQALEEKKP